MRGQLGPLDCAPGNPVLTRALKRAVMPPLRGHSSSARCRCLANDCPWGKGAQVVAAKQSLWKQWFGGTIEGRCPQDNDFLTKAWLRAHQKKYSRRIIQVASLPRFRQPFRPMAILLGRETSIVAKCPCSAREVPSVPSTRGESMANRSVNTPQLDLRWRRVARLQGVGEHLLAMAYCRDPSFPW